MIAAFRPLPRPHALRATRSRMGLRAALLAALAVSWLTPHPARADCVEDDSGLVVECTGQITQGYASDLDGVELTVHNADMTNGDETDTIRLTDQSVVNIEADLAIDAQIHNDAPGGAAVSLGDDGVVSHSGMIDVLGPDGVGIKAQDGANVVTSDLSQIILEAVRTTGIRVGDDSLGVTHGGEIRGDAVGSIGILVGSNNLVSNDGSITLDGDGAIGVWLFGANNALSHTGSLTLGGAGAAGVAILGDANSATSLGSITLDGDNSTGVSILGHDNLFTNLDDISAMGAGSVGVLVAGSGAGTAEIVNLGSITVGPDSGPAVSFELSSAERANRLESGIDSVIDAGTGTAVLGSAGREVFENAGVTIGEVDLAGGDDTLELREDAQMDLAPVTLGDGNDSFELFGGGSFTFVDGGDGIDAIALGTGGPTVDTLDLSAIADFEILDLEDGEWTLQNDASFDSGIFLFNGVLRIDAPMMLGGNMFVSADEDSGAAATLALSSRLDLAGDYTQLGGSTFAVSLGSGGANGLLAVDGAASIADGSILGILEQTPLSGSFTILTATGGIDGTFTELPEATPVLSFALNTVDVAMGQELVLEVMRNAYTMGATTPNQTAVAGALDDVLLAGPNEAMQDLLASLDRVSFADYGAALDSLHPEAYDAQTSAMLDFGYEFARLAASNLFECAPSYYPYLPTWITSGPPCTKDGWTPWIGGFGGFGDRNGGSGHVDYSGDGGGVAVGVGRSFGSSWEVSGYVGGGFGSLDVSQVGDGTLQTFELGVGAVRRIGDFSLRGVLDYGHGWHQQDRHVAFGTYDERTSGEYESNRVTGLVEAAWQLVAAETNFFEPVASVDFTWLDEEAFSESGGRGANLHVDDRSQTVVSTTLGIRLVRTFLKGRYTADWAQWANGTWRPELDVRWRANWTDVDRDISARFSQAPAGTGSFTVKAQDAKQGAEFSIGTTYQPYKTKVLVAAGYRGFVGDGTQTHTFGAEVRIPF